VLFSCLKANTLKVRVGSASGAVVVDGYSREGALPIGVAFNHLLGVLAQVVKNKSPYQNKPQPLRLFLQNPDSVIG
jgi:hypothetical protein